jgi:iron complex outermembrane receptor protein
LAQETNKDEPIETVVVSARRREEPMQKVPAAITAFTAQQLEDAGVRTLEDVAKLTPNFSFRERYRPGMVMLSLRGIGTNPGGEAPVSVVLDGVSVPGLDFLNQQLLDIESVQILKGPQGALYGKGAVAGAVLIESKQPSNTLEGGVKLSYGNGRDGRAIGSISGPIVKDKVFFSLSASTVNYRGLIKNPTINGYTDSRDDQTFNGHLKAILSNDLTLDIRTRRVVGNDGAGNTTIVNDGNYRNFSVLPNMDFKIMDRRTLDMHSVALKYKTSVGTLSAVTGYSKSTSHVTGDVDLTPADMLQQNERQSNKSWSQDIRFTSPDNQPLRWIVGAFYQDRDTPYNLLISSTPTTTMMPPNLVLARQQSFGNSKASALYSQVTYALSDKMELEGALRYDQDKRSFNDFFPTQATAGAKFSQIQPKVSLKYDWNDRFMTYASYGQGFRSGGFNSLSAVANIPRAQRVYPKEVSDTIEVGFKSQSADRRFTLNAALFSIGFKNQQFTAVDPVSGAQGFRSMEKTTIKGLEIDFVARPFRRLELGASVGVADAVIKDGDGNGLYAGNKSPQSYASTLNLSAQYTHPLQDNMRLFARADYARLGKIYFDEPNAYPFGPSSYLNGRLAIEKDSYSIGFYGRNLTNQRAPLDFIPNVFAPGVHVRFPNQPRQYGIELILKM